MEETSDDIVAEIKNKLVSSNKQHTIDEELECYQTVFDAFQIKCFTINQVSQINFRWLCDGKVRCATGFALLRQDLRAIFICGTFIRVVH